MQLASGQVKDRPWGQTLAAVGLRGLSGQLTLHDVEGKAFCVAFDRDAVIGATSPLASDAVARVALTNDLITSSQVARITRELAAQPGRDEVDVLAEVCQLDAHQVSRLRRRMIAQCAARTFSVDDGAFTVDDHVTIATTPDAAVDLRAVVYLGVRRNLSEQRLAADLRALGSYFTLRPEAAEDLPQFGLTTSAAPILEALGRGATIPELEALHDDPDRRSIHSAIYALVSCGACDATLAVPPRTVTPTTPPRTVTRTMPPRTVTPTTPPRTTAPTTPPRTATPTTPPRTITSPTLSPRTTSRTLPPRTITSPTTPPRTITSPTLSPRTTSRTIPPRSATPTTPPRSATPTAPPRSATPTVAPPGNATIDRVEDPLAAAANAFRRGQAALRDDRVQDAIAQLAIAVDLNPHAFDYAAVLAWAQFCGAPDQKQIAEKTRKMLGHAVQKSPDPKLPLFYLGRMERMLGHEHEALRHFRGVLEIDPRDAEAVSEIRLIETRLAAGSGVKPGLSRLFRRK